MAGRFFDIVRRHVWLIVGAALSLMVLGAAYMLFGELDVSAVIRSYGLIAERVESQPVAAFLIATGFYALLVVFLLPGVPLLSIPIGLILGWGMAIAVTMTATLLGISILYGLAVWVLPDSFGKGKTSALDRMARGLRKDAVGYMLFLRLMPPVPFTLLNVGLPALRVRYDTFVATTLLGMFPRFAAYCFAGEGLRGVIDDRIRACAIAIPQCTPDFELGDFVTREIALATGFLALVSLAPIVYKRLAKRD